MTPKKWRPPVRCPRCDTPLRKFAKGDEIPCAKCSGELCEKCCDQRQADLRIPVTINAALVKDAIRLLDDREWISRWAAENQRCLSCEDNFPSYQDQDEHHPSCEFVRLLAQLKSLLEGGKTSAG